MNKVTQVMALLFILFALIGLNSANADTCMTIRPSQTIQVDGDITGIAIDSSGPSTNKLFLADYEGSRVVTLSVSRTSGATMDISTITDDDSLINNPLGIAINPVTMAVYVTSSNSENLYSVIVNGMIFRGIPNPFNSSSHVPEGVGAGITIAADMTFLDTLTYITDYFTDRLFILNNNVPSSNDDARIAGKVMVENGPAGIALKPGVPGSMGSPDVIYVVNSKSKSISVVESGQEGYQVIDRITLSFEPSGGIVVDPSTGTLYVASKDTNSFAVIKQNDDETYSSDPIVNVSSIAINPSKNRAYLVSNSQGTLTTIDTTTNQVNNCYKVDNARSVSYYTPLSAMGTATGPTTVFVGTSDGKLQIFNNL